MRLRCSWDKVSKKADKTDGAADVELTEHLQKTEQNHLPQSKMLTECLNLLIERDLLEEAYMRGSLGRGHGDIHSDIDLFTVVDPHKLEDVYNTVCAYLESKGHVVTACYDRLVENYGGIGFMFIAENAEHQKTFQFDLYMAMKGTPPRQPTSIKPRIYAKDPHYKWTEQFGKESKPIPVQTQAFMDKHMAGSSSEDRMELLMKDLLITMYVTNKHIMRGQTSRVVLDDSSVVSCAIEFLQTLMPYKPTGYSALYLGNEIVKMGRENGDAEMVKSANALEKLFLTPMSQKKLRETLRFAKTVLKQAFPERYARQKDAIEFFEREILVPKKKVKSTIILPKCMKMKFKSKRRAGP